VRNFYTLLLIAGVAAGGWYVFKHYRIQGLDSVRLIPKDNQVSATSSDNTTPIRGTPTIRIASFNVQVFGTTKINKPHVVEYLAQIARQFDVIAVQEIRSRDEDIIPRFVEAINSADRHYDYVIGPRLPHDENRTNREQYAFIFDQATLEVDRQQLYTINDPDNLLVREPLVGWFRVRGPPDSEAFTFTLVNVHTDPDVAQFEVDQLGQVYQRVLNDGRGEDDVILLGDFNVDERHLGQLAQVSGIDWAIKGVPTNTRGSHQYDNIVYNRQASAEFTGRVGVFDFLREYSLNMDQALEISDHLPVWAEFHAYEGGREAAVAETDGETVR
jgi:endonuclease/exonuclease/phosphatase family metal-dependent hydrolase